LEEFRPKADKKTPVGFTGDKTSSDPVLLKDISLAEEKRLKTKISEFDRVLGGGAVKGSVVLIGGTPGIGKSTLLLQACANLSKTSRVLYVSGEESLKQIKVRAERLLSDCESLFMLAETDIEEILSASEKISPDVLIIDSIQTMYRDGIEMSPGNITQIKECAMAFSRFAKSRGVTTFIVGHVNKDGAIAGPKVLEHMVDCVLYFEGEQHLQYRMLRAAKNRYGSTNEIGMFEMTDRGLQEIENPSASLLSGRPKASPGSCVACTIEGSRPVLAEIQALVSKTVFGVPRRMASGIDYNRSVILLAILEKRSHIFLSNFDTYLNVVGGLKLNEPSIDLPAALAIVSSFKEKPILPGIAAFGEMGLTGELRAVSAVYQRICEIRRLGFDKCIIPYQDMSAIKVPQGLEIIQVKNINEAIDAAM